MKFEEFEGYWPADREGESFANKFRIEDLRKEEKTLPTGRWLWGGILLVAAASKFFDFSWQTAVMIGALLCIFEIINLLSRVIRQNHELRVEIENIKGSIRENRWTLLGRHENVMRALDRDEFGSPRN